MANGGFFLANLLSCFHPIPLTLTTPVELRPYGWTTADLWCAPLITGLYALLTHAQPFWGELHEMIAIILGANAQGCVMNGGKLAGGCVVESVDEGSARAICALILSGLFVGRTAKNFAGELKWGWKTSPVMKGKSLLATSAEGCVEIFDRWLSRQDTIVTSRICSGWKGISLTTTFHN